MRNAITLSKTAIFQFRKILTETNTNAILFSVKGGGCSGFEYDLTPTNNKPSKNDELYSENGVNIHICGNSLMHILGTHIDWNKDIMGETFKFSNPMAKASCGCGTSFNPFN
jgi:iron-sulfur cluster assembly accessory protein